MPKRSSTRANHARNARRASSIAVVVALGLAFACGCSFPVEDFSEQPDDAASVDGPPLGDPGPDAAHVTDAKSNTGSTGGGSSNDDHQGKDHGKKKGNGS